MQYKNKRFNSAVLLAAKCKQNSQGYGWPTMSWTGVAGQHAVCHKCQHSAPHWAAAVYSAHCTSQPCMVSLASACQGHPPSVKWCKPTCTEVLLIFLLTLTTQIAADAAPWQSCCCTARAKALSCSSSCISWSMPGPCNEMANSLSSLGRPSAVALQGQPFTLEPFCCV